MGLSLLNFLQAEALTEALKDCLFQEAWIANSLARQRKALFSKADDRFLLSSIIMIMHLPWAKVEQASLQPIIKNWRFLKSILGP